MRRLSFLLLTLLTLAGLGAAGAPAAQAAAPTVSLATPANGAFITGGQPTFSGQADGGSDASDQVTISVYSGTSTGGGLPVLVLDAPVAADGSFSARAAALPDGTYSAVATESSTGGQTGSSPSVTFYLSNAAPALTLNAPPAPITTPSPTFTGTALTANGAGSSVFLAIYAGSGTDSTPLAVLSAAVGAGGHFSLPVLPGLANGSFSAVAGQSTATGTAFSPVVHFSIATGAPALSLSLARGAILPQTAVVFHGVAGDLYGDGATVAVVLYRGARASGTALGHAGVTRTGAAWSLSWGSPLTPGTYTVTASQSDVSGQTTTITRTFTVAVPTTVSTPSISAGHLLRARVRCLAGAGVCRGDLLVLSLATLRTTAGGPLGRLSLLFRRFTIPAGHAVTLSTRLSAGQAAALAKAGPGPLILTVIYRVDGRLAEASRITAPVRVGSPPATKLTGA